MKNTAIVELRYQDTNNEAYVHQNIDGLNDILVSIAYALDMDILSVSHSHHIYQGFGDYSTSAVFMLNGKTPESIATYLDEMPDILHAFAERGKVSVIVSEVNYNA